MLRVTLLPSVPAIFFAGMPAGPEDVWEPCSLSLACLLSAASLPSCAVRLPCLRAPLADLLQRHLGIFCCQPLHLRFACCSRCARTTHCLHRACRSGKFIRRRAKCPLSAPEALKYLSKRKCERWCGGLLTGARLAAGRKVSGMGCVWAACYVPPSYRACLLFFSRHPFIFADASRFLRP